MNIKTLDTLRYARQLVAWRWTKGALARNRAGQPVCTMSAQAEQFSISGAIARALGISSAGVWLFEPTKDYHKILNIFGEVIGEKCVKTFNDEAQMTKKEMLSKFDNVISFVESRCTSSDRPKTRKKRWDDLRALIKQHGGIPGHIVDVVVKRLPSGGTQTSVAYDGDVTQINEDRVKGWCGCDGEQRYPEDCTCTEDDKRTRADERAINEFNAEHQSCGYELSEIDRKVVESLADAATTIGDILRSGSGYQYPSRTGWSQADAEIRADEITVTHTVQAMIDVLNDNDPHDVDTPLRASLDPDSEESLETLIYHAAVRRWGEIPKEFFQHCHQTTTRVVRRCIPKIDVFFGDPNYYSAERSRVIEKLKYVIELVDTYPAWYLR